MNYLSLALVVTHLVSSAQALITFSAPVYGSVWYTSYPNSLTLVSDNPSEAYANVRISGCRDCFDIPVYTNQTTPIYIPRNLRDNTGLNIYATSNMGNTASTGVILVNPFASQCCGKASKGKACCESDSYGQSSCGKRPSCRNRCQLFGDEEAVAGAESTEAGMVAVDPISEDGKLALAAQEVASIQMFEDLEKLPADSASEQAQN